ncbi:MAG: MurT ligase domain-containing protein [Patescibacteria group bacterium]|nr:MurT ligase domain-containing protein [Patescibacteria group bacterium]
MFLYIFVAKIVSFLSEKLKIGSGSTWPGHLILKFDNNFIEKIIKKNPHLKIIFVAGTNGKTTTVSLLSFILKKLGYKVFYNQEGANLVNGIISAFIKNSDIFGNIKKDYAVFEVDEFSFPQILKKIPNPQAIIILNLFRDQLDRYGEVNTIGWRWFNAFKDIDKNTLFVVNADDPFLYHESKKLENQKIFFGIDKKLMTKKSLSSDIDFSYCPNCQNILTYKKIAYSHLGDFYCQKCGFKRTQELEDFSQQKIRYQLYGIYNIYNTNAVLSLIKNIFQIKINFNYLLKDFQPAFGRQEEIIYKNRKFFILLSKNPAGFNQSIQTIKDILKEKKANFLIILNNRIPDGLDISWIWDVDFQLILENSKNIYISGDRAYDMGLRFKYEEAKTKIFTDFKQAINEIVKKTKEREKIFVLPTYSAMLELRKFLIGRKLL